jgi:alkylation response protein AidB-like acyl-CoA dehydrogenase
MESSTSQQPTPSSLETLPGDDVRQIMWRFADRYDLQMLIQSSRAVARGPVARLVAQGGRNSHEWTPEKAGLLQHFDESGITAAFLEPEYGGFIEGPKNLALALIAFELSWVDAGAATGSLAGNLGLAPIHERGTPEQRAKYVGGAVPLQPGEDRVQVRAAFALTEPIPFVGVETGMLAGKVRVAEWNDGHEPMLHVDKRGRFITNMGFANVVTAAVDSDDPRIKGSCMVILEEGDPGIWDRGTPTKKLVHQLSSTNDPVFNMTVPASRIVGGYTIKDGVIIPKYSHAEIIEAVFRRTRVTVGLMTSAKLLSAVEPVILYQRRRFRGGQGAPGTPRYELGIQQKEDALHRLVDIWATGEASASLGFEAARLFDEIDPLEKEKDRILAEKNLTGRAAFKELTRAQTEALEALKEQKPVEDPLMRYARLDSLANVLCPACKLWNTGHGATMMREAVSLMGGYGVTEDCPGFLGQKWMDAQLEATYEGPEAVQRLQLSITMTNALFLEQFRGWIDEMERLAKDQPGTGAGALVASMRLWLWTLDHLQEAKDDAGGKLYHKSRQGVTFPLADALCWLLAVRQLILDVLELDAKGPANPALAAGVSGTVGFLTDLCRVQSARAAGEVGRICAELVHGHSDVPPSNGAFAGLRATVDASLAGCLTAKDRAAEALTKVMTREALDYPV